MSAFPTTRPSMLAKMRQGDDAAWIEFDAAYTRPALGFLSGHLGMSVEDTEDLWQEVLLKLYRNLSKYDAAKGRFRSFLLQAAIWMFRDRMRGDRAMKRDRRLTESLDAPESPGDPVGPTRIETWIDEDARRAAASLESLWGRIEELLRNYPHDAERRVYVDWLQDGGGSTEEAFARARGLKTHQFRYLRSKVEEFLESSDGK